MPTLLSWSCCLLLLLLLLLPLRPFRKGAQTPDRPQLQQHPTNRQNPKPGAPDKLRCPHPKRL
jgi:hypothetical protein